MFLPGSVRNEPAMIYQRDPNFLQADACTLKIWSQVHMQANPTGVAVSFLHDWQCKMELVKATIIFGGYYGFQLSGQFESNGSYDLDLPNVHVVGSYSWANIS